MSKERQVRRALVLGGGHDQVPLFPLLAARGVEAYLLDYLEDPPARALAVRHFRESTHDRDAILRVAREAGVDLLISAGNDAVVVHLASVSKELGLPHNMDVHGAQCATDKRLMKSCFRAAAIPMPAGGEVSVLEEARDLAGNLRFPLVAKPAMGTSSKGVVRVPTAADLERAWEALRQVAPDGPVVLEEYIQGAEVSVDCFALDGQVHVLGITQLIQVPGLEHGFSFMGTLLPAPIPDGTRERIHHIADQIAPAFGLGNGPFFFQAMVKDGEVHVLEMGARTAGGAKYRFIQAATGFNMLEAYVDMLTGTKPVIPAMNTRGFYSMNHVYALPGRITEVVGMQDLLKDGTVAYFLPNKPVGSMVGNGVAARDRVISFMAHGTTMVELHNNISKALTTLRVLDAGGSDLIRRELYPHIPKIIDRP